MSGTVDIPRTPTRDRGLLTRPAPRAPEPPPIVTCDRIGPGCYAVFLAERVVGFIDVVGPVSVALAGCRYDRAVEVAQSVMFERAVAALVAADDVCQAAGPARTNG